MGGADRFMLWGSLLVLAIIVGAAMLVSGAVVVSSIRELRAEEPRPTQQAAD